jgi:thioredoxin 1
VFPQAFNCTKEVLRAHEPVLVGFWASWGPPCQAMSPVVESPAPDFKVGKVNVGTNRKLASQCGVSSIPVLLIVKDGKVTARHFGVAPEATLRAQVRRFSRR